MLWQVEPPLGPSSLSYSRLYIFSHLVNSAIENHDHQLYVSAASDQASPHSGFQRWDREKRFKHLCFIGRRESQFKRFEGNNWCATFVFSLVIRFHVITKPSDPFHIPLARVVFGHQGIVSRHGTWPRCMLAVAWCGPWAPSSNTIL